MKKYIIVFLFLLPVIVYSQSKPCDERKYTVSEIRELRVVCEKIYIWGTPLPSGGGMSWPYMEADKVVAVEEMIRTYMLAGITAKDIIAEDKKNSEPQAQKEQETK